MKKQVLCVALCAVACVCFGQSDEQTFNWDGNEDDPRIQTSTPILSDAPSDTPIDDLIDEELPDNAEVRDNLSPYTDAQTPASTSQRIAQEDAPAARTQNADFSKEVMAKLENIQTDLGELRNDLQSLKNDVRELQQNGSGNSTPVAGYVAGEAVIRRQLSAVPSHIMGSGQLTEDEMAQFLLIRNPGYQDAWKIANLYKMEAVAEGVNHDIAFAQMCLETNYLKFTGVVPRSYNNFGGFGAYPGGDITRFLSAELGVRAQIQHLKAYATTEPIKADVIVDPRYEVIKERNWLGTARTVYELEGKWATDEAYGTKITNIMTVMYRFARNNDLPLNYESQTYGQIPTRIMGTGTLTAEQMEGFLLSKNPNVPDAWELAWYYIQEAEFEGVNHDVAFAQMCHETGYLRFGGMVKRSDNNFGGLGAFRGSTVDRFNSPREGVRAQIQLLKMYATRESVKNPIRNHPILARLNYIGAAPTVYGLTGRWASDPDYANKILAKLSEMYRYAGY